MYYINIHYQYQYGLILILNIDKSTKDVQVLYLLFYLFPALLLRALPSPFPKPQMYSLARFSFTEIHRHRGTKLYVRDG